MKRFSPLWLAILVFAGCHAPVPSFDVLAPYGSTRIPPPSTGIISPGQYYQQNEEPASTPAAATGFRAREPSADLSAANSTDAIGTGVRTAGAVDEPGAVTQAALETTSSATATANGTTSPPTASSSSTATQVNTGAPRSLPPNIRGMHINEAPPQANGSQANGSQATDGKAAAGQTTAQVIDITQLPPATTANYAAVVPRNEAIGSSVPSSSNQSTSGSQLGWQTRE